MPYTKSGATRVSFIVIIGLVSLKIAVGIITSSLSVLAQAADSLLDLVAIAVTFIAIRSATKPADEEHPFGHGKIENISATLQAILIFTTGGLIIYYAVRRLTDEVVIGLTEAGIGVMLISIATSILLSRYLLKASRALDSLALEAIAHNIAADVYSAAGVLIGLAVIRFTGLTILDPIVALIVALLILKVAFNVLKKSFDGLIDTRLPKAEEDEIIACLKEHSSHLVGFHEVRSRKAGKRRFIDLHLVMPPNASVEETHQMCDHLEQDLEHRLSNTNVTIHVEPCTTECDQCSISCSLRRVGPSS